MAGTCGNAGLLLFSLMIGGLVATIGYTPFFVGLRLLEPRRRGRALVAGAGAPADRGRRRSHRMLSAP